MPETTRRDILKLASAAVLTLSGLLGLEGLLRFLSARTEPEPQTDFDLGSTADYPVGSRTVLPQVPALLMHSAEGFSAISLVCTHLGCTVEASMEGFSCPCHGSKFDLEGKVVRGPAAKPLKSLRVEVTEEGSLYIFSQ